MSFFSRIGVALSEPSTIRGFMLIIGGISALVISHDPEQIITGGSLVLAGILGAFVRDVPAPEKIESVVKDVVEVVKKAKKPKTDPKV